MDINDLRSLATVTCFIALSGVFWWAYSPKRKKSFDEAANLPFGNDTGNTNTKKEQANGELNR